MGLTSQSTGASMSPEDVFYVNNENNEFVIALAGNPNTGKSTVFNYLTGLKQHTGNWPGKTVVNARGEYSHNDNDYILVDLPGSYSLFTSSQDEAVAKEFICYGNHNAVIVVADSTCIERNLNLLFQVMEITPNVILCLNLIDEANKKNIVIDKMKLEDELGVPVVLTAARSGIGMDKLKKVIEDIAVNKKQYSPKLVKYDDDIEDNIITISSILEKYDIENKRYVALRIIDGDNTFLNNLDEHIKESILSEIPNEILTIDKKKIREDISKKNYEKAKQIKDLCVKEDKSKIYRDKRIDDILTSKRFGIPIMLLLLGVVLWITITGANYPSQLIGKVLFCFQDILTNWCIKLNVPDFIHGVFVLGMYRTLAWVVSVMLPPMAIFFPLFTLLEDLGYLPRVAFNLDHKFKKACAHGKQCLCMCMGLGCNAAGIIGCRIIDSPRERMIAILTNNFMPCNGRFPTLVAISSVFFAVTSSKALNSLVPALSITACIILGIAITLLVSYLLSKTLLKGVPSTFTLELPPYRVPKIGRVIYTSIIDRTLFVLGRAVVVAAPAGAITWLLANINIGDASILTYVSDFLAPFANLLGFDGFILMAFILGIPANEIVLPILLMAYLSTGSLIEFDNIAQLKTILVNNGWTYLTALNTLLFSLLHWPCSTTLMTIKKETGSWKWTIFSFIMPTVIAIVVCMFTTFVYRMIF